MTPQVPKPAPTPYASAVTCTLEELARGKAVVLQQIQAQKRVMAQIGQELTAPFAPAAQKGNSLLRAFNRGMAVFDGVMLGMKVMRQFRSLFGKKRRYRY